MDKLEKANERLNQFFDGTYKKIKESENKLDSVIFSITVSTSGFIS